MCQAFYIERCWLASDFKLGTGSTLNDLTLQLTAKRPWVLYPLLFLQVLTLVANIYLVWDFDLVYRVGLTLATGRCNWDSIQRSP